MFSQCRAPLLLSLGGFPGQHLEDLTPYFQKCHLKPHAAAFLHVSAGTDKGGKHALAAPKSLYSIFQYDKVYRVCSQQSR
jgi:hypothetical protein